MTTLNHLTKRAIDTKVAAFRTYSLMAGVKESTLYCQCIYIKRFMEWLQDNGTDERYVSKADVLSYRAYLLQAGIYSNGTINNKITALFVYYRYLFNQGVLFKNPVNKDCYVKKIQGLIRNVLSIEDMGKLLGSIIPRTPFDYLFKSVCEVLYSSGLRISECLGLQERDIDRERGYIMIHELKVGRERRAPIGEVALRSIDAYMKRGRVFLVSSALIEQGYLYPQNRRLIGRINSQLHDTCKKQEIPVVTTHSFRHSCATHMLKKGANIKQIQEFLGHASIKGTQVYTHIMTDDLKKVVITYHPRGKETQ